MKFFLLSFAVAIASCSMVFGQIYTLPYTQDFDTFPVDNFTFGPGAEPNFLTMDWINVQTDAPQDWYGRSVATGSNNTGPTSDHTSGTGAYLFVEDGFGANANVELQSPGIDLSAVTSGVELSYWAHSQMIASPGNAMMLQASTDLLSWMMIDSFGVLSSTDMWFNRTVDLSSFIGDTLYLKWIGNNINTSFQHDIAIDDVSMYKTPFKAFVNSHVDVNCFGASTGSLSVSTFLATAPITYSWDTGDTTDTISGLSSGVYCCTIIDANMDTVILCDTILDLNPPFSVANVTSSPTICIGDADGVAMVDSVIGGIPIPGTCGLSTVACNGPHMVTQVDMGSGINGGTEYPAPFGNWFWGARHQMLYRASELQAAGFAAGNIDSIGFPIENLNTATSSYSDFTVSLGCTQDSVVSNTWVTGTIPVFNDAVVVSVDTIWLVFTTPYFWNGNDNLIVETCFNNAGFTNNVSHSQTTTSFESTHFVRADNSTVCGNTGTSGISFARPNILFGHCSAQAERFTASWSNGDTGMMVDSLSAGSYTVTITDFNGCVAQDSIVITNNTPVSILDASFCSGDSVIMDAAMPEYTDYLWSTGESTAMAIILAGDTVTVSVVDSFGCMSSDSAIITENVSPTLSLVETSPLCNGGADGSIDATVSSGTPSYVYIWSTTDSTEDITGLSSGSYSLTVLDSLGCMDMDSIFVDEPAALALSVVGTDEISGADGTADLTVVGGTLAYTYDWNNLETTEDLTGLVAGTYDVIVTDANGCFDSIAITIGSQVGIDDIVTNRFNLYPNPSTGVFYIQVKENAGNIADQAFIMDAAGRKVLDLNFYGVEQLEVDFTGFERGMYFFIVSVDGKQQTMPIVLD